MHVMSHTMPVSRSLRLGRPGRWLRVQRLQRKRQLYSRSAARCFNAVPWPGPAYANIPFRDNCAPVILAALLQVALPWECSEGGARMHIACATTWNWMAVHNHVPRTI
jgi:hypothetical protein